MPSGLLSSWLKKRGAGSSPFGSTEWRQRWFILDTEGKVRYYKQQPTRPSDAPQGLFCCKGATVHAVLAADLEVHTCTLTEGKAGAPISQKSRVFHIQAESSEIRDLWLSALQTAAGEDSASLDWASAKGAAAAASGDGGATSAPEPTPAGSAIGQLFTADLGGGNPALAAPLLPPAPPAASRPRTLTELGVPKAEGEAVSHLPPPPPADYERRTTNEGGRSRTLTELGVPKAETASVGRLPPPPPASGRQTADDGSSDDEAPDTAVAAATTSHQGTSASSPFAAHLAQMHAVSARLHTLASLGVPPTAPAAGTLSEAAALAAMEELVEGVEHAVHTLHAGMAGLKALEALTIRLERVVGTHADAGGRAGDIVLLPTEGLAKGESRRDALERLIIRLERVPGDGCLQPVTCAP